MEKVRGDWVKRTCCRMAGEEKFGYFRLGEGTVLVLSVKKVAKSSAVIEVVGGGGGGQRRELNVLKRLRMSGALLILLWKCEDLAVWTSVEKDESKD